MSWKAPDSRRAPTDAVVFRPLIPSVRTMRVAALSACGDSVGTQVAPRGVANDRLEYKEISVSVRQCARQLR